MAKGLRAKVKKRLRTVKRGVIKKELRDPTSKLGKREVQKESKNREALSGHLEPGKPLRSAFRYDDGEIAQHDFRQGPDFRANTNPEAGFAVWGSNRPKLGLYGGDAPSARVAPAAGDGDRIIGGMDVDSAVPQDPKVALLIRRTEQVVPLFASKRTKKRLKNKSGTDHNAAFRWA